MTATIVYKSGLTKTDPQSHPVLILGQLKHLRALKFEQVACKLQPHVTSETFSTAVCSLNPSPTDSCPLYLNLATIAALPVNCSRHNAPSRAHALTKLIKISSIPVTETIVIVCTREDAYASGCAVARAYPLYNNKSGKTRADYTVNVEFLIVDSEPLTNEDIECLNYTAHGIRLTAKIVDAPTNFMNVHHFLEEINSVGKSLGITPMVIRGEDLNSKGFGGIYGVGKASTSPPALAVLSYKHPEATKTVAWVGKGITYDTGGLSIKSKTGMPGMKRDCGGAAAILGGFYAAVKNGFKQNLHAVFCLAENSVGPNATRPDDVHTLYSGRTVEINNTDAEGRLVLADGVAYANKDLKADIILDMATLTGAQGIATGAYHGAVLTNSQEWEVGCVAAGKSCADLVFPIPFTPELHFSQFDSVIADMKNSVADRENALSSCAGLFIMAQLGFDFPGVWMHVDMAYPVSCGERGTGYGVAFLCTLFGKYSKSKMLQAISPDVDAASTK
ncbi:probable aminopeptidase NPEPL1 [Ctenocephalides felis]|uniref:probable aminopeptidase NPEPL1 n=1 Tax=Ctenocephalides felis TaxID=7515 RepID=UPI000E6E3DA9|nr:probable aminopeptidase NPEPL1 [Ctenocephalides felis]XP_026477774.1 probable aminopeptidase NPEPL1 [Ctenocephalides felis]